MACCVFTAYIMNRIIQACELFDVKILDIKYNDFDDGYVGYEPKQQDESPFVSARLLISGMTCSACVGTIEKAVSDLKGVDRIAVSLPLERATVIFNKSNLSVSSIITCIEEVGYGAKIGERTAEQNIQMLQHTEELDSLRKSFNGAAMLSSVIAVMDRIRLSSQPFFTSSHYSTNFHILAFILACWIQIVYAKWIHQSAFAAAKKGLLNMDSLISLSLLLGMVLSIFNLAIHDSRTVQTYFSSTSFLTTVITAGRYLETLLKKKNVANFTNLYKLQAESEKVKVRSKQEYIPAALLRPRDEIIIEPTAIIPCDCYVLEGSSTVDQSTMTGEPVPVAKSVGDFLLAGTRNITKKLIAVVHKEQRESALDQLIESIGNATERKLDGQEMVESMTSYFVSGILVLTAIGFISTYHQASSVPSYLERLNMGCERAMAILSAACPCAFGLAMPAAVMAGIDAAWSCGALLTAGAKTIQNMSKLTHIVMDKTGTLTQGRLHVSHQYFHPNFELQKDLCYLLLCCAERDDAQSHPVAKAVFQWSLTQMNTDERLIQSKSSVRFVQSSPGRGISCEVEGHHNVWHKFHVGSQRFLEDHGIKVLHPAEWDDLGTTCVHFAIDECYAGSLALRDTIRPEAENVIDQLKQQGVILTMLTGDVPEEAKRVSKQLGIEVLGSKSLPHEKKELVESLQTHRNKVAMVGDGINDAPAQMTADVGIQLTLTRACAAGSADVVILSPDLTCLPKLLHIARLTMRQARWNVQWAICYNIIAISFAMGVGEPIGLKVSASTAGIMMAFSSISVLGMSLYLRRSLN